MAIKYVYTNIICKDYRKLADFYIGVFECEQDGEEFEIDSEWLVRGVQVKDAKLKGVNLKLPGNSENGPTMELLQYTEMEKRPESIVANRQGYGHIAFKVDDIESVLAKAIDNGGKEFGEIVKNELENEILTFVYITDPEGNIVELMKFESK